MSPRYAEGAIREALADTRVVAISGPRQAGETTLARKITGRERTFLTLDDAALLASARRDPNGLVRSLDTAVIDEIQRAPELLLAIKQSVDEDPRPGRFLITGSANLQAIPRTQDSLAGRTRPASSMRSSAKKAFIRSMARASIGAPPMMRSRRFSPAAIPTPSRGSSAKLRR